MVNSRPIKAPRISAKETSLGHSWLSFKFRQFEIAESAGNQSFVFGGSMGLPWGVWDLPSILFSKRQRAITTDIFTSNICSLLLTHSSSLRESRTVVFKGWKWSPCTVALYTSIS